MEIGAKSIRRGALINCLIFGVHFLVSPLLTGSDDKVLDQKLKERQDESGFKEHYESVRQKI